METQPLQSQARDRLLLVTASLVLMAGITPPAGADTASDLQQFEHLCLDVTDGESATGPEDHLCVPNLGEICGEDELIVCEFEATSCEFFCDDEPVPLIDPRVDFLTIPGVEAWVSQCRIPTGLMVPQLSIDAGNRCPIGQSNICDDEDDLEYGDFPAGSTLCWRVFIPEDQQEVPDGFTIDDVNVPVSMAALCQGALTVWVGDVNVVPGATAVAPCSEGS